MIQPKDSTVTGSGRRQALLHDPAEGLHGHRLGPPARVRALLEGGARPAPVVLRVVAGAQARGVRRAPRGLGAVHGRDALVVEESPSIARLAAVAARTIRVQSLALHVTATPRELAVSR